MYTLNQIEVILKAKNITTTVFNNNLPNVATGHDENNDECYAYLVPYQYHHNDQKRLEEIFVKDLLWYSNRNNDHGAGSRTLAVFFETNKKNTHVAPSFAIILQLTIVASDELQNQFSAIQNNHNISCNMKNIHSYATCYFIGSEFDMPDLNLVKKLHQTIVELYAAAIRSISLPQIDSTAVLIEYCADLLKEGRLVRTQYEILREINNITQKNSQIFLMECMEKEVSVMAAEELQNVPLMSMYYVADGLSIYFAYLFRRFLKAVGIPFIRVCFQLLQVFPASFVLQYLYIHLLYLTDWEETWFETLQGGLGSLITALVLKDSIADSSSNISSVLEDLIANEDRKGINFLGNYFLLYQGNAYAKKHGLPFFLAMCLGGFCYSSLLNIIDKFKIRLPEGLNLYVYMRGLPVPAIMWRAPILEENVSMFNEIVPKEKIPASQNPKKKLPKIFWPLMLMAAGAFASAGWTIANYSGAPDGQEEKFDHSHSENDRTIWAELIRLAPFGGATLIAIIWCFVLICKGIKADVVQEDVNMDDTTLASVVDVESPLLGDVENPHDLPDKITLNEMIAIGENLFKDYIALCHREAKEAKNAFQSPEEKIIAWEAKFAEQEQLLRVLEKRLKNHGCEEGFRQFPIYGIAIISNSIMYKHCKSGQKPKDLTVPGMIEFMRSEIKQNRRWLDEMQEESPPPYYSSPISQPHERIQSPHPVAAQSESTPLSPQSPTSYCSLK